MAVICQAPFFAVMMWFKCGGMYLCWLFQHKKLLCFSTLASESQNILSWRLKEGPERSSGPILKWIDHTMLWPAQATWKTLKEKPRGTWSIQTQQFTHLHQTFDFQPWKHIKLTELTKIPFGFPDQEI